MNDRLQAALREIGERMSVTGPEFARVAGPGGDMVLDGLRSRGLVNEHEGRFALSDRGAQALEDKHDGIQGR